MIALAIALGLLATGLYLLLWQRQGKLELLEAATARQIAEAYAAGRASATANLEMELRVRDTAFTRLAAEHAQTVQELARLKARRPARGADGRFVARN